MYPFNHKTCPPPLRGGQNILTIPKPFLQAPAPRQPRDACHNTQAPVFQHSVAVIIKLINHSGEHSCFGQRRKPLSVCKIIAVQTYVCSFQHTLNHLGIPLLRDPLKAVVEIVVIIGKAHRQEKGPAPPNFVARRFRPQRFARRFSNALL